MITQTMITRLFMMRQHFLVKADYQEYEYLFRQMSPVSTLFWTRPGDPPVLAYRADFDDIAHNDDLRSRREIIKGRFQKGAVGYIFADELELYAALYKTDLGKLTKQEHEILDLLEHEGSMNIHELKEVTKMFVKDLAPVLHRLQEGYKVYEDQRDREWDRNWYAFENEFPEIDLKRYSKNEALKIVLLRYAEMTVFFSVEMVKSFYKLPAKEVVMGIQELVEEERLVPFTLENQTGYLKKEDYDFLNTFDLPEMSPSVFMLHRNDFLVKSHETELKKRFEDKKVGLLYYLLIDGAFKGALFGRFTFGPVELTRLVLDLPEDEITARKAEILKAIYTDINPDESPLPEIKRLEKL